jgi:hypothetical protein
MLSLLPSIGLTFIEFAKWETSEDDLLLTVEVEASLLE